MAKFINAVPMPSVERTQFMDHGDNLRNVRYCEIIPVFREGAKLYIEVYNTVEYNELPEGWTYRSSVLEEDKIVGRPPVIAGGLNITHFR